MTIAHEIEKLQQLHAEGTLTDAEFAQAKTAVLARYADDAPPARDELDTLRFENELARIDREWALQRETFMVSGRYGARHIPTEGGSLLSVVAVGGFGLFWLSMASSMGGPSLFPLFGLLVIAIGVGFSVNGYIKAGAYKRAEQAYQDRRAALIAQYEQTERAAPPDY
jgi:hypothetical protein